jgi:hypothetical protein
VSRNGSGIYILPATSVSPAVSSTLIESAAFNTVTADLASALTQSLAADGQTTITANISLAGFKLTGVGAATARTDAASLANTQDQTGTYVATVGGTVDAITLTPSPAITAYAAGQRFTFIASGANTTAVTVQISGLASPKAITKNGTTALVAGDIASSALVDIIYDGTRFQLAQFYTMPAAITPTTIELGHASDTTLARVSAGLVSVEGINLVRQGDSFEIGHASDTTLTRVSAGKAALEGQTIATVNTTVAADTITSGTYTPTVTNNANVASSIVDTNSFRYIRIGSQVFVSGVLDVAKTAAAPTATSFLLTLPIASTFTNVEHAGGNMISSASSYATEEVGIVVSGLGIDATKVLVSFFAAITNNRSYGINFSYTVI